VSRPVGGLGGQSRLAACRHQRWRGNHCCGNGIRSHQEPRWPHHRHGPANPHIWLDLLRAVQQVQTIRDALVSSDPACVAAYQRRAGATISSLKQLNRGLGEMLAPYRSKTFVAFHDNAPYFAQRYGLKVTYLVGVPEQNPSPADLMRVTQVVRASQLQALMSEPQ
ncbi:MAG: hypothetical protein FJ077_14035, partial [Cyanobacteria bacterium K_DeepCast_35m_m2_023]|nr:hypothetical protein [Cyanobacteria bacterium K_DeepCast_35m_m2_023]